MERGHVGNLVPNRGTTRWLLVGIPRCVIKSVKLPATQKRESATPLPDSKASIHVSLTITRSSTKIVLIQRRKPPDATNNSRRIAKKPLRWGKDSPPNPDGANLTTGAKRTSKVNVGTSPSEREQSVGCSVMLRKDSRVAGRRLSSSLITAHTEKL